MPSILDGSSPPEHGNRSFTAAALLCYETNQRRHLAVQDKESSNHKAKAVQQQLEQQQQQLTQQLQQLKADEANLASQKLQLQV